jgi:hypothetical protein
MTPVVGALIIASGAAGGAAYRRRLPSDRPGRRPAFALTATTSVV